MRIERAKDPIGEIAKTDHRTFRAIEPWVAATVGTFVFLGPALGGGTLLNLDLVVTSRLSLPSGVWGLGPELPRRVPYWVVVSWFSGLIGTLAGTLFFAIAMIVAFAGAYRLAARTPRACRLGAGALYAFGPFMLTRVAVGHAGVVAATAILPWVLPTLLHPARRIDRTFVAASALAFAGPSGGTLLAIPIVVGLVADRRRGWVKPLGAVVVAQLPWLVPALVVSRNRANFADSRQFSTDAHGVLGLLRLVAGHGFWRGASQVGGRGGIGVAVLGAVLVLLAVSGSRALGSADAQGVPAALEGIGPRAAVAAGIGFVVAGASAMPVVRGAYAALSRTTPGVAIREGQRLLPVFLVWLAPAAAAGAARLARSTGNARTGDHAAPVDLGAPGAQQARLLGALPLACAFVLAASGAWGLQGAFRPVALPADWGHARQVIRSAPGTVVALPFHEYLGLPQAEGRIVLNPLPTFLGGDVIASSDPELGRPHLEVSDPREPPLIPVLTAARSGRPVADQLAASGIRWVVVLHDLEWEDYAGLDRDPGLRHVLTGSSLDVYRVLAWQGPVRTTDGRQLQRHAVIAPVGSVASSAAAVWDQPASWGWMRGFSATGRSREGLIFLPAGRGLVWYWPACLVLLADILSICLLTRALRHSRHIHANADAPLAGKRTGS